MNYDEGRDNLARWFVFLAGLLIIAFTAFDLFHFLPAVSDAFKLAGIVLCFLFTVVIVCLRGADFDRVVLMVSLFFAIIADALLLFTPFYFWGVLIFCIVQELQSVRIFSIRRSVVRMDGRISASYRSYKVRNYVLLLNLIQLLFAAVPVAISFFVDIPQVELISVSVFYIVGFIGNLIPLGTISRDVRLLDDMLPLRLYFIGMLLYFICDILLGVFRIPEYLPVLPQLKDGIQYALLVIWPLYLAGMVCIALGGLRSQRFYS